MSRRGAWPVVLVVAALLLAGAGGGSPAGASRVVLAVEAVPAASPEGAEAATDTLAGAHPQPAVPPVPSQVLSDASVVARASPEPVPDTPAPPESDVPPYSYEQLTADLAPYAAISIGETAYGRQIWAASLGDGPATVLLHGAHHGSEWLTTPLLVRMLADYAGAPDADLLSQVTIWFVPMVNPDGVTLQQQGVLAFPEEARPGLIAMNGGSTDFSWWKANGQGVDLNRQYPAQWEAIRANVAVPALANHKGAAPLTAPEAVAMADFTATIDPEVTVSYHASGHVIYWHFYTDPEHVERDRALAQQLADLTGYALVPPEADPSGGGYKDWFVQAYGRPGYTLEIAPYAGGGPPPASALEEEWERNREVGWTIARAGARLWRERNQVASAAGQP
jgi:g-D-glutamyl-meso-diaminopimelate peptidase